MAERRGARVLARNWRGGQGELDLVLDEGGAIVFVEVKTRSSQACGSGFESVTRRKQRKIAHAALAFLSEHALAGRACRFDVAVVEPEGAVTSGSSRCSVRWLEDAFSAAIDDEPEP